MTAIALGARPDADRPTTPDHNRYPLEKRRSPARKTGLQHVDRKLRAPLVPRLWKPTKNGLFPYQGSPPRCPGTGFNDAWRSNMARYALR
jgi:hypothetical protein